jgi:hypothetical protein
MKRPGTVGAVMPAKPKSPRRRTQASAHERFLQQRAKRRDDGDRFKATDKPEDVVTVLLGMFSAHKAEAIGRGLLAGVAKAKTRSQK